jgi:hypothetical protein
MVNVHSAHFSFNKGLIYTHDGASAKFSTNSHETENSVLYTPCNNHIYSIYTLYSCRIIEYAEDKWLADINDRFRQSIYLLQELYLIILTFYKQEGKYFLPIL